MVVFVSGHHNLDKNAFNKYYIPKIKELIINDRNISFVVGFYSGCDNMFLEYINSNYINLNVTIYACEPEDYINASRFRREIDNIIETSKNNISVIYKNTLDECDKAMTEASNMDLAFIYPDRTDSYTAKNILRRYLMI